MNVTQHIPKKSAREVEREIGRVVGDRAGATLIAVAGIHGNEQAGIEGALRVLARLGRPSVFTRGELVVFAGNVGAIRENRRYRRRDLNRVWTDVNVDALAGRPTASLDEEEREQRDLLAAIETAIARARGPVYLVDLHTTSAHGTPFVLFGDTLAQRDFASELPLPIIMGLEEQLDGVLSAFFTRRGVTTFAVEGGQHKDPGSIDNLEAVLLVAAEAAGIVSRGALAEVETARSLLEGRRGDLPRVMEVLSRHSITPEDEFTMAPGFRNLDFAKNAQLLARDRRGEIRAPQDGLVILPLYQGQGEDGFFWGREVSPARLRASATLRRMGLERLLPLLPGVEMADGDLDRLRLSASFDRIYPRDLFHMFGFRRIRSRGNELTVERAS